MPTVSWSRARSAPAVAAAFLALAAAAACSSQKPAGPPAAAGEEHYLLLIDGEAAGRSVQATHRSADGSVRSVIRQDLKIRRVETPLEVGVELELREDAAGAILEFRMVQRLSETETVTSGKVEGSSLALEVRGQGEPRRTRVNYDSAARGPHWIEEAVRREVKKPGDRFSALSFAPETFACGKLEVFAEAEETLDVDGRPRALLRQRVRREILPGNDTLQWVDADGEVWRTSANLLGFKFEERRSSPDAIARALKGPPPELFLSAAVRPDRPLREPERIAAAVYRLRLKRGEFGALGAAGRFQGGGQSLVREEDPSTRVVRIERVRPARAPALPVAAPPGEEACLAPGVLVQSDDLEIRRLAGEIIAGARDALDAAERLERWVHDAIAEKGLDTAFASASETLKRRQGDCTEHGVLLAALARAAGLPARVACGLVYHQGEFVGHLWNEVWIDRWVPLDATRPDGDVGPDHIALLHSALAEAAAAEAFFGLVPILGNLSIEVLEP
jgi:hypothetical protein